AGAGRPSARGPPGAAADQRRLPDRVHRPVPRGARGALPPRPGGRCAAVAPGGQGRVRPDLRAARHRHRPHRDRGLLPRGGVRLGRRAGAALVLPGGGQGREHGRVPPRRLPRQAQGLLPGEPRGAPGPGPPPARLRLHRALPVPGADPGRRHRRALDHRLPLLAREGDAAVRRPGAAGGAHPRGPGTPRRDGHRRLPEPHRGRGALPGRRGLRGLRELRREGRPAHRRRVLLRDQPAHRPQQLLRDRGRGERGPPRRRRPRPRPGHHPGRRHGRDPLLDPAGLPGAALPARSRAAHADPAPGAHRAAQPLPVPSGRPVDAGLLRRLRPELRAQVPRRLPPPHRHRLLTPRRTLPMPETPARSLADAPAPGVDLVLLGGDIGIYALARAFHERYRISATVVTRKVAGPVADSSSLRTVELGMDATEDDMLRALEEVGADKASRPGGTRPILLANADFLVALLAAHRERLSAWFHLPLLDDDVLEAVADTATFSTLCAEIDVPTPRTVVLDFAGGAVPDVPELDLGWPLVAKASRSSAYNAVSFPGKRKVFEIADRAQLVALAEELTAAGYRDRFVV